MSKKHESHIIARAIGMIALIFTGTTLLFAAFFLPMYSLSGFKHISIWFWILAPLDIIASFKIGLPRTDLRPLLLFFMLPILTGLYFREGWIIALGYLYISPILVKKFVPKIKDYLFLIRTGKDPEKVVQIPENAPFEAILPSYIPNNYKMNSFEYEKSKGIDIASITYTCAEWDPMFWLKEAQSPIPDLEPKKYAVVTFEKINGIEVKIARLKSKKKGDLPFTDADWNTSGLYFNLRALGVRDELVIKIISSLIR